MLLALTIALTISLKSFDRIKVWVCFYLLIYNYQFKIDDTNLYEILKVDYTGKLFRLWDSTVFQVGVDPVSWIPF